MIYCNLYDSNQSIKPNPFGTIFSVLLHLRIKLLEKAKTFKKVSGFGNVCANGLLIYLPELGHVSNKRIASIVGTAPFCRDGNKEMPEIPIKQKGKRGRVPKSDAHNLLERLIKYEDAVLLFAKNPDVSFTNNRAERDLRMVKVKQKVSGCFRTDKYAHAYCRITSYLQTMANKGVNRLIAIESALSHKI